MMRGFEAYEIVRRMEEREGESAPGYGMRWQPENWKR
jgi:hypothetical protein